MEDKSIDAQDEYSYENDWVLVQTPEAWEERPPATTTRARHWANISSDLQTLLNAVKGVSQLVLETDLTQEQRQLLTAGDGHAQRLQSIFNNIHTTFRIEEGYESSIPDSFFLSSTVVDCLAELKALAKEKKLDIVYQVESALHNYLTGDRYNLRRILINLVETVIMTSQSGKIYVSVSNLDEVEHASDGGGALKFGISYTANPQPNGKPQDPIFDIDRDLHRFKTEFFDRRTLSLFVVRRLVELVGGKTWTEVGFGPATLYFSLPFGVKDTYFSQAQWLADQTYRQRKVLLFGHYDNDDVLSKFQLAGVKRSIIPPDDDDALSALLQDSDCSEFSGAIVDCLQSAEKLRATEKLTDIPILTIGSTISMDLSIPAEYNPISTTERNKPPSSWPVNILVAQHNDINQKVAARYLRKENYKYHMVKNGFEALEQVKETKFDIVLMDVCMPVMSGLESTAKIREWESENNVPRTIILALTAHMMKGDRERLRSKQFEDVLSKPLKRGPLLEAIDHWTDPSRAPFEGNSREQQ